MPYQKIGHLVSLTCRHSLQLHFTTGQPSGNQAMGTGDNSADLMLRSGDSPGAEEVWDQSWDTYGTVSCLSVFRIKEGRDFASWQAGTSGLDPSTPDQWSSPLSSQRAAPLIKLLQDLLLTSPLMTCLS